ncbi:MAG: PAS domain S-box protein [Endomicrobiales bacterium]|nr:PAS domain S-box protein [Endomicrobiales bacterium]
MPSKPIFSRIPWPPFIVFTVLFVSILSGGIYYFSFEKKILKNEKITELTTTANLKVDRVVEWRKTRIYEIPAIFGHPLAARRFRSLINNPGDRKLANNMREWLTEMSKHKDYYTITVVDRNAKEVLSCGERKTPLSPAELDASLEAMKNKKPYLSNLHSAKPVDIVHLDLNVPLILDNECFGAVFIRIDPGIYLFPMIQLWPSTSQTAESLLVMKKGEEIVFLNNLRFKKDSAMKFRVPLSSTSLPAVAAVKGHRGIFEGRDYRGENVVSFVAEIPDCDWYLIAKIDEAEIFRDINRFRHLVFSIIILLILSSGLAVSLMWYKRYEWFLKREEALSVEKEAIRQHYALFTKYANDAILLANIERKIIDVNERAIELYGYSREEFYEKYVEDLRARETRGSLDKVLKTVEKFGGLVFETSHVSKDGAVFPVEVSSRIINIGGNKFIHAIIRDITDRKAADKSLKESEDKYRLFFENILHCVAVYKPENDGENFVFTGFNAAAEKADNISRDKVLGKRVTDVFPAVKEFGLFGVFQMVHKDGVVRHHPITLYKDHRLTGWRDNFVFKLPTGEIVSVYRDATKEKLSEMELKISEEKYRALVENAGVPIFSINREGVFLVLNSTACRYMNKSAEELTGKTLWDIYPKDTADVYIKTIRKIIDSRKGEIIESKSVKGGNSYYFLTNIQPIFERDGLVISVQCIVHDMTAMKKAEAEKEKYRAQLIQSSKMAALGQMAAGITHEINNPMTIILGNTQHMLSMDSYDAETVQILNEMHDAAQRCRKIILDLLDFSRTKEMIFEPKLVNQLVDKVLGMINLQVELDNSIVTKNYAENLPPAKMSSVHIEQVLVNIILNAGQAMPGGGALTVATRLSEDAKHIEISVSDTGVGMSEEVISRLFEPFFTTKPKGTGLGLAVSYGIIQQHDGSIKAASPGPGRGTTFTIKLPVANT